jgi:mono/diheme cytochrome c family protein
MKKILAMLLGLAILAHFTVAPAGAAQPSGQELVDRLGCLGCHSLHGKGGDRGPAWDGVGARLTPEAIETQIVSPQGRMPSFAQVKPEELKALVTYLSGLK